MAADTVEARNDRSGSRGAAEDLELPRPLRPLLTAGWSLAESVGLAVAACLIAGWIDGRNADLVAGLAVIWLTAVIRKVATGSVPGLLTISVLVLTVQAVLMLTELTALFLLLSTMVTTALVVAGTGASTWLFRSVLRRLGLRLRFAPG